MILRRNARPIGPARERQSINEKTAKAIGGQGEEWVRRTPPQATGLGNQYSRSRTHHASDPVSRILAREPTALGRLQCTCRRGRRPIGGGDLHQLRKVAPKCQQAYPAKGDFALDAPPPFLFCSLRALLCGGSASVASSWPFSCHGRLPFYSLWRGSRKPPRLHDAFRSASRVLDARVIQRDQPLAQGSLRRCAIPSALSRSPRIGRPAAVSSACRAPACAGCPASGSNSARLETFHRVRQHDDAVLARPRLRPRIAERRFPAGGAGLHSGRQRCQDPSVVSSAWR